MPHFERLIRVQTKHFGESSAHVGNLYFNRGICLYEKQRFEGAVEDLNKAIEI